MTSFKKKKEKLICSSYIKQVHLGGEGVSGLCLTAKVGGSNRRWKRQGQAAV